MWDWVGFGANKVDLRPSASPEERILRSKAMLARVLNLGTAVAVVGNGCSRPLGYPSWSEFTRRVVAFTLDRLRQSKSAHTREFGVGEFGAEISRLEGFQNALSSPDATTESERLMAFITVCQQALLRLPEKLDKYHEFLTETFEPQPRESTKDNNPHRALLDLPIHRFVTTNYDCELELALAAERGISLDRFGLKNEPSTSLPNELLGFTQESKYCAEHALFTLAWIKSNHNMVFHCHGRFDNPETIIASETDYQDWYLADQTKRGATFRHTMELLLSSNHLLFVGYGLEDQDLLRPIRTLRALEGELRNPRLLFALVDQAPGQDLGDAELFFHRYGVHIIPFDRPKSSENEAWGTALCNALKDLGDNWRNIREKELLKPALRRVKVRCLPPEPYRYPYIPKLPPLSEKPTAPCRQIQNELQEIVRGGVKVLVLTGPSGGGKTWHAIELFTALSRDRRTFDGCLFWDAHFSDDAWTGLETVLGYLDPDHEREGARLDQLRACLHEGRYLIVIEGCDRLLHETGKPGEGMAYNASFRKGLESFADPESQSTVVLVSSLWPRELDEAKCGEGLIQRYPLPRIQVADVETLPTFEDLECARLSELCGLLDGHGYGLLLARSLLSKSPSSLLDEKTRELCIRLAEKPLERRVDTLIQETCEQLDSVPAHVVKAALQHLAVFISPLGNKAVDLCLQAACRAVGLDSEESPDPDWLRKRLLESELVLGLELNDDKFFAVHPRVRSYLYESQDRQPTNALPSFGLSGLTASYAGMFRDSKETGDIVKNLFDELATWAENELRKGDKELARKITRRLFSLMRSRMSTFGTLNWVSYKEYACFAYRLLALVKETSPRHWISRSRENRPLVEDRHGVLYAGDLSWLYNELGLILEVEGHVSDAAAIWEQSYEINRLIEGGGENDAHGEFVQQSLLNLSHSFIDRGELSSAEEYLRESERVSLLIGDQSAIGCTLGYRAMVTGLQNARQDADHFYEEALSRLKESGNRRAQAYFLAHRALLKHKLSAENEMREMLYSSQALVHQERYVDLELYIKIAWAQFEEIFGQTEQARLLYDEVLRETRAQENRKIEAITLSDLSRLALKQGDVEGAQRLAIQGLSLGNVLGLRSRQIRSLLGLGKAMVRRDQVELGLAYLRLTWKLARETGNWSTSHDAKSELQKMGESPIPVDDSRPDREAVRSRRLDLM